MKPELRSTHRIYHHPHNGDVRHSNIYVTIVALTREGPWIQPVGMPVIQCTWAQWEKMVEVPHA